MRITLDHLKIQLRLIWKDTSKLGGVPTESDTTVTCGDCVSECRETNASASAKKCHGFCPDRDGGTTVFSEVIQKREFLSVDVCSHVA